jgi:GntR family transcriptional regulator, transcriptional repressor for pyruvate dehydrogenase complex
MTTTRSGAAGALTPVPGPPASLSDAVLRPVRDGNAFESTVEHLAMAIRLGVFAEGERLPSERDLAERLKVGRATLREAIGALRQAGLVRTRRGRSGGTVVLYRGRPQTDELVAVAVAGSVAGGGDITMPRYTPAEVADALAFRSVVEPGAARLAARADLSADQRAWLRETLRATVGIEADGARRVADSRLHLAIATLSGSAKLVEAVSQARSMTADLLCAIPVLAPNIAHSDAQHAEIVEAVLTGDHLRAQVVMEEHCEATSALVRALLT